MSKHRAPYATRFHRDGTVTVWNVYTQQWDMRTSRPSDSVLASLSREERERVIKHLKLESTTNG